MGTFGDSWQLTKTSFRVIRDDKALLVFPLISGLCALAIIVVLISGLLWLCLSTSISTNSLETIAAGTGLVAYFLLWILSVFFAGALVGAATIKLNGGQPTVHDGLRAARARLGKLVLWALLGGSLMLLIRIIAARVKGIAGLLIGLAAGVAIGVATYFIVPVLMFENESTWGSLKRSASLFKNNFGRTVVSNLALALVLAAGFVPAVILLVVGIVVALSALVLGLVLVMAGLTLFVFMLILASAVDGVLCAALYRYAATGQTVPGLIHPDYLVSRGASDASSGSPPLSSAPPPSW
jgi:uncharacterized protein DUF6159